MKVLFDYSDSKQYVFSLVQNWSSNPWTPTAYTWDGLVWLGAAQGVLMSRAPTCIGRTNHAQTNHRCMGGFPLKSAEELTTYQMMNGQERKQLPIEQATSWLPNKGSGNVELICGLICPSGRANAPSLLGCTYTSLPGVPYNLPAIKSRWWAHHSMPWWEWPTNKKTSVSAKLEIQVLAIYPISFE